MTAVIRDAITATGSSTVEVALTAQGDSNLVNLLVLFDAAPTTSENLTLKKTAIDDGAEYTLFSIDPSASSATTLALTERWFAKAGDIFTVDFANTDTATYNVQMLLGENGGG